jgi:tripartite-type tricarboxylate transporter receptor subunit TctC
VAVPKGTDNGTITVLNKGIELGLVDLDLKSRLAGLGASAMLFTPQEFERYIAAEANKWGGIVRSLWLNAG